MQKLFRILTLALCPTICLAQSGEDRSTQGAGGQSELNAATEAMGRGHHHEGHHHVGAHMRMTALRKPQPLDAARAQAVADEAREALEHYRDYRVALDEGYRIFLPNVPQKMYHFTNYQYAIGEAFRFDASKPTSLLYEKHGSEYKLVGAMYTAPFRFSEEVLNERIPLSVAQWHLHVNMCRPPSGREIEMLGKKPKFGLNGSISTRAQCEAAGGTFMPHVFGWMVHVYPWEKTADDIWSVERQLDKSAASERHEH